MKYNTVTSFEDHKTFTCDTQDFVYPAVVEEHKEKHGENAILLVTTPKAGARGANLIAYGKDAISLFRLFGEYTDEMNEKMKGESWWRVQHAPTLFYTEETGMYHLSLSANDYMMYKEAIKNSNLDITRTL